MCAYAMLAVLLSGFVVMMVGTASGQSKEIWVWGGLGVLVGLLVGQVLWAYSQRSTRKKPSDGSPPKMGAGGVVLMFVAVAIVPFISGLPAAPRMAIISAATGFFAYVIGLVVVLRRRER